MFYLYRSSLCCWWCETCLADLNRVASTKKTANKEFYKPSINMGTATSLLIGFLDQVILTFMNVLEPIVIFIKGIMTGNFSSENNTVFEQIICFLTKMVVLFAKKFVINVINTVDTLNIAKEIQEIMSHGCFLLLSSFLETLSDQIVLMIMSQVIHGKPCTLFASCVGGYYCCLGMNLQYEYGSVEEGGECLYNYNCSSSNKNLVCDRSKVPFYDLYGKGECRPLNLPGDKCGMGNSSSDKYCTTKMCGML